jgi:hypothetical protein
MQTDLSVVTVVEYCKHGILSVLINGFELFAQVRKYQLVRYFAELLVMISGGLVFAVKSMN